MYTFNKLQLLEFIVSEHLRHWYFSGRNRGSKLFLPQLENQNQNCLIICRWYISDGIKFKQILKIVKQICIYIHIY